MRLLRILALTFALAWPDAATQLNAQEAVRYNNPELHVDLGVGLWAWPMPMDWDDDGDVDLVVSCPDVPFRGTWLFRNPGGDAEMPVFDPPIRVGDRIANARLSWVSGAPRVLAPATEWTDFLGKEFEASHAIYPRAKIHQTQGRVRANQWHYADLDSDGRLDLVVGVGDWADYGWDDAYDEEGNWTNGPLHGFVYWLRNAGSDATPAYDDPQKLKSGERVIDVYGMPSPCLADFDSDGDLDLICGEFLDGFTYFRNDDPDDAVQFAEGVRLRHDGSVLQMDLQMITPTPFDWNSDGHVDLIVGDEDGRVAFVKNTGALIDGVPQFLPPEYFQQKADRLKFGALVTPFAVDWDSDGDDDLICGNTAGYIGLIRNLGGSPPRWDAVQRLTSTDGSTIRYLAGSNGSIQGPAEAKWGYTTLSVVDWDMDGRLDVIVNSIHGRIEWLRNVGTAMSPQLQPSRPLEVEWNGDPPTPAWNWKKATGKELITQWRTTPWAADMTGDDLPDLVCLDHEGYLSLFERERRGAKLVLKPPVRIFKDEGGNSLKLSGGDAGKSGRRKFCFADWDGDEKPDLLINSANVDLYRNVSDTRDGFVFRHEGPLSKKKLAGHTTSPTTMDFDGNGSLDILLGAEDGHIYLLSGEDFQITRRTVESRGVSIAGRDFELRDLFEAATAYSNRR